ncbi:MAG: hypothetical protein ACHQSE_07410 [Gemmatimonadales bacterium]
MNLPPWLVFLAVVPPLALGVWYAIRAYRLAPFDGIGLFVAFLYGMTVEALSLHTKHQYDYANWVLMFSVRPNWVPYAIGVCWASVMYVVMRTSDALNLKWWHRPVFDGAAAMIIDLMLDPSMSATRMVANLNFPCMDVITPPSGGLGLWTWCVTPSSHTPMWFTVPIANFLGWWAVIMMFSIMVRIGARYCHPEKRSRFGQFLLLLGLAAVALGGCFIIGPMEIRLATGPDWLAYAALATVTAAPLLLVLSQAKHLNFYNAFPAWRLAWPAYAYLCWGGLFFFLRLDGAQWPGAAWLMVATIIFGALVLLLPYLGTITRRRAR